MFAFIRGVGQVVINTISGLRGNKINLSWGNKAKS